MLDGVVMKLMTLAFLVATLSVGCSKKGDGPARAIAKVTEFKDRMCACKDKACGDAVDKELQKWMADVAATGPKSDKPTKEEEGKLGEVLIQMTECLTKLSKP